MRDDALHALRATILALLGVIAGALTSHRMTNNVWQDAAIKHGAAHYDAETVEFRWNEVPKK